MLGNVRHHSAILGDLGSRASDNTEPNSPSTNRPSFAAADQVVYLGRAVAGQFRTVVGSVSRAVVRRLAGERQTTRNRHRMLTMTDHAAQQSYTSIRLRFYTVYSEPE